MVYLSFMVGSRRCRVSTNALHSVGLPPALLVQWPVIVTHLLARSLPWPVLPDAFSQPGSWESLQVVTGLTLGRLG
jgi:hypothetical protein